MSSKSGEHECSGVNAWIWETERLIEEMKAVPSDPGIDWVRGRLEEAVERKRRLAGLLLHWVVEKWQCLSAMASRN